METSRPRPPLRGLRLTVLAAAVAPVLILALLWLLGQRFTGVTTLWIALPSILGIANLVLVPAVGSTIRQLPHGIGAPQARRIAAGVLRTVTLLRLALAQAPALFGLVASLITGSLLPYGIGLGFAVVMLLGLAYPSRRVLDGVRARLESDGTASHLWEELGSPNR
jgi:hypothetical protein